jgi:hypothetical protein
VRMLTVTPSWSVRCCSHLAAKDVQLPTLAFDCDINITRPMGLTLGIATKQVCFLNLRSLLCP